MPSDSLNIANSTGFPLQIAVEDLITRMGGTLGWRVKYVERGWQWKHLGQSGFIDLVLESCDGVCHALLECKRTKNERYVFIPKNGRATETSRAKVWVTHNFEGQLDLGWRDVVIQPPSSVAAFCAVRGHDPGGRNSLLERLGSDLVSAVSAYALGDQQSPRSRNKYVSRCYIPVLVTTATLEVLEFSPSDVSIETGELRDAKTKTVPWVRLRKELLHHGEYFPDKHDAIAGAENERRENTLFVVNSKCLDTFLKQLSSDVDSLLISSRIPWSDPAARKDTGEPPTDNL
jgi:hypothetical protein